MFGEGLPHECDGCGEDVAGLYDHADDCDVAHRIAQRQVERIQNKPQGWPTESDEEHLERMHDRFGVDVGGDA